MSYQPFVSDQKMAFGALHTENNTSIFNQIFIYGINTRLFETKTTGSGITPTVDSSRAKVETSANINSSSLLRSKKYLKYHASIGCEALFTGIFTSGVIGSNQYVGIFNDSDGFAFGYQNNIFGILHKNGNSSDTFIPQSSWNRDTGDNTNQLPVMDWTKGNVFKIEYQYLGFGAINFYVEQPCCGNFILIHRIEYANSNTVPSLSNPNLPYSMLVENTTNSSNIILMGSSIGMNIQGKLPRSLLPLSVEHTQTIGATEINVVTIDVQNPYLGKTNNESYKPILLSYSTYNFNKPVIIYIKLGSTLSAPSFTNFTDSFMKYDISTSTISAGQPIFTLNVNQDTSDVIDLSTFDLVLNNQSLTISASTSGGSGDLSIGVSFIENL